MVWGWVKDKVSDTASAATNIVVGVTQPVVENTFQAATAVGTGIGGATTYVAGKAVEGTGAVLSNAGLISDDLEDRGAILAEFGAGVVEESGGQLKDAAVDTFSADGEVAGGLAHAGTNAQSILFDWSEDDEGYMPFVGTVNYEEERSRYIADMKQDDQGWTGDGIMDLVWGTTGGSMADAWRETMIAGTESGDEEALARSYETWTSGLTDEQRYNAIDAISDEVILLTIGATYLKLGGAAKVRKLWKAGGYATKAGMILFTALVSGTRLGIGFDPDFEFSGGDGDTGGRSSDPEEPEEEEEVVIPPPEPEDDEESEEEGVNPFDPDEDDEPSDAEGDAEEEQTGRHPTEEELAAMKAEEERRRRFAPAPPREEARNPYMDEEYAW